MPAVDEGDAYRLKLEYDQVDGVEGNTCQLFTLRIAAKPLGAIADENLSCDYKNALPPAKLKIPAKEAFRLEDKNFAVSSEWLDEHVKNKNTQNRADFDIHIEMEADDFYLNAELGTNFLTGMMDMTLYAKDETTK